MSFPTTRLSRMLDVRYPIVQAGMAGVAGPELVAAVSEAGGLGVLGGYGLQPAELREQIRAVRRATRRPFGVNLWIHAAVIAPGVPDAPDPERVRAVQATLDRFRGTLGLPAVHEVTPVAAGGIEAQLSIVLEECVPLLSVALGDPRDAIVERCRQRGTRVMAMISTVEEARAVARSGVDIIVAQGNEAGGHHATWTSATDSARPGAMALLPRVIDVVDCPVLVAGAVADGRGVASALCLGASGVVLGTRFVATRESRAPAFWKAAIVLAEVDATVVTSAYTGLPARAIRNAFSDEYAASASPVLPPLHQKRAAQDILDEAKRRGDARYFHMWAGQSAGLVHDIPGAAEVVERLATETTRALARVLHGAER